MIGRQQVQVGLPHAGKTADITIESDTYLINAGLERPAKTNGTTMRRKASDYGTPPS